VLAKRLHCGYPTVHLLDLAVSIAKHSQGLFRVCEQIELDSAEVSAVSLFKPPAATSLD